MTKISRSLFYHRYNLKMYLKEIQSVIPSHDLYLDLYHLVNSEILD